MARPAILWEVACWTRNGHDWAARYPLIVEAVNHLRVRSVLIDGEVSIS